MFLIMGNAGFRSSTIAFVPQRIPINAKPPKNCKALQRLSSWNSTIQTVGGHMIPYRTEGVHFINAYELSNEASPYRGYCPPLSNVDYGYTRP